MTTTTYAVHEVKGGDRIKLGRDWREVFDVAQPALGGGVFLQVFVGDELRRVEFASFSTKVEVA